MGKIEINTEDIPVDYLSMSAHKLYGPKGVGALYKRGGTKLDPLIHGGGQESNLRASTENVGGIGGFGMAAELSTTNLEENTEHILRLETYFLNLLNEQNISYSINGKKRIPGVFNITFHGVIGQDLVLQLDFSGIGISNPNCDESIKFSLNNLRNKIDFLFDAEEVFKLLNLIISLYDLPNLFFQNQQVGYNKIKISEKTIEDRKSTRLNSSH